MAHNGAAVALLQVLDPPAPRRKHHMPGGTVTRIRRLGDENVQFRKSNMAAGRHFEIKSIYLHISSANQPNLTKFGRQVQILTQATET